MNRRMKLPPEPGTAPIPPGHVRLYHQTDAECLPGIKKHGLLLSKAKGIEGPCRIYATETPFYGSPSTTPTVEFHAPRTDWEAPCWMRVERVPPSQFIAVHEPWHHHARYMEAEPDQLAMTLAGEHDALLTFPGYGEAIRWIKKKYGGRK